MRIRSLFQRSGGSRQLAKGNSDAIANAFTSVARAAA